MPANYIVIHCSDSPNYRVDRRADGPGAIHRWHREKGWDGIGYHYVIDEHGVTHHGRPVFFDTGEFWQGAHVGAHNHEAVGICLIGAVYFHPDQLNALRGIVQDLKQLWPDAEVVGHYQLDPNKTCPNFDVPHWLRTGDLEPHKSVVGFGDGAA